MLSTAEEILEKKHKTHFSLKYILLKQWPKSFIKGTSVQDLYTCYSSESLCCHARMLLWRESTTPDNAAQGPSLCCRAQDLLEKVSIPPMFIG